MQRRIDRVRPIGTGVAGQVRSWLALVLFALVAFWAAPAAAQIALPNGQAGQPYAPVTLNGGPLPITAGNVVAFPFGPPFGMSIDPATGVLDGTPLDVGDFLIDVTFTGGAVVQYSLTIADPNLVLDPTALPPAMVGRPYSAIRALTGVGSGFSITCTCVVDVAPPQPGGPPYFFPQLGIDHDPVTGEYFGTPTDAGTITIEAHAFDAGLLDVNNPGPWEGPAVNYTLVVTPALAFAPTALPNGTEGAAYSQPITPPTGGTGPFTYAATGTLPTGISVDPATGAFTGTPAAGTAGFYNVQVKATDANGFDITAAPYNLTIDIAAAGFPPTTFPDGTRGVAYSQAINPATGGREPFTYAHVGGAFPQGVTFDPATRTVSGTPGETGTFTFEISARDALLTLVTQTYTLTVADPALALPATALPGGTVLLAYDQSILPATGGLAPYTYAVTGGALPIGVTMDDNGRLTGTPGKSGAFSFTVTATDSLARTVQQTYGLAVSTLPDPRTADLLDLIKWQHHAAGAMASDQTDNIQQRLEQIHSGNGSDTGVVIVDQSGNAYLPTVQRAAGDAIDTALDAVLPESFGAWSAGKLTVGTIDQAPAIDFTTSSLTVGWDVRISEMLTLGLAGGFGADRGMIGATGTTGNAVGTYAAGYASLQPGDHAFVDAVLGAGVLDYETTRFDPVTGGFVTGHRDGRQVFGSLAAGAGGEVNNVALSGYARLEGSFARLAAYTETGGAGALVFDPQDVWAIAAVIGGKAGYSFHLEWGDVTPSVRVEYRHGAWGASDSSVNYSGLLNVPGFGLTGSLAAENAAIVGLQTAVALAGGLALSVEYDARFGTSGTMSHTVKGIVSGSF